MEVLESVDQACAVSVDQALECAAPGLSTPVLKTVFSQSFSFHTICLMLRLMSWNLTAQCLAVTGGGNVGE